MKLARNIRGKQLGLIHMVAATLGMDTTDKNPDSEYRSMLWALGRVRSAADLDFSGRKAVLDHLRARGGFKVRPRAPRPGRPRPPADRIPMVAKIRAILAEAGRADAYADGIAMKMFNVQRYEWLPPDQMHKLVSALVYDQQRRQTRESHGS